MQTKEQKCTQRVFKKLEEISILLGDLLDEVATTLDTKDYTNKLIEENHIEMQKEHKNKETRRLSYNPIKNIVTIHGSEEEFDKDFIKYLLEYLEIPTNAQIIFENKD